MNDSRYNAADPARLADLLSLSDLPKPGWRAADLGAILKHQLSAPVQFDLAGFNPDAVRKLRTRAAERSPLPKSFADLLLHPNPPIDLLKLTKDFAKANRNQPESPLPPEIATLLYFASIAAALVRLRAGISELDSAGLTEGFTWCRDQAWLDPSLRPLFNEALDRITPDSPSPA